MILFCLPYAGGSEAIYYKWKKYLDPRIELNPIELKGRGKRFNEDFYETLQDAVDDIFNNIKGVIGNDDYAIYGHSMGSLLAYETYYKVVGQEMKKPTHMFFSGHEAPSTIKQRENTYKLPDYEFIKKVIDIGGTPKEIMENRELLEMFVPIIRNDFRILETYEYKEREKKIECNISILNGKQDDIKLEEILAWNKHVCGGVKVYNFQGNHFFINNNVQGITNIINGTLLK